MKDFIIDINGFAILNLLIIAIVLISKKNTTSANLLLSIYILLHAVVLILNVLTYINFLDPYFYFLCSIPGCLIGPFSMLYCKSLLNGKQSFTFRVRLHFIPALALPIIIVLTKYFQIYLPESFLNLLVIGPSQFSDFMRKAISCHMAGYYIYNWITFNKLKNTNKIEFNKSTLWIKDFILITNLLIICYFVFHFLSIIFINPVIVGSSAISPLIIIVFYFLFLIKSFSYSTVFNVPTQFSHQAVDSNLRTEKSDIISEELLYNLDKKLNYILTTEKPYLNQKLTIKNLAEMLDTSVKNISQLMNNRHNKNFKDFINYYRMEESKKMLLDHQNDNLKLEAIAEAAGFNSRASFYAIFKKFTGHTPASYRKEYAKID